MQVKETKVSTSKISSTIDLKSELQGLTKAKKTELLDQIGELLVEQVLSTVAESKSPITGRAFKGLSQEYKALKLEETGSGEPNLDLSGEMLSSLDYKVKDNTIELGIFGEDAGKADGHNNFSGKSKLPTRQFLPKEGELFVSSIKNLVKETVDAFKADNLSLDESKLKYIENKKDLYDYLQSEFDGMSRGKIKELILQSELSVSLDKFNLLELL